MEPGPHREPRLTSVVIQIMLLDIVFSLDSTITAVGLSQRSAIQVASIVIAVVVMLFASRPIGDLVDRHPSLKILALCFLLLIGTSLIAEGFRDRDPARVHLLRDGLLGLRRVPQHPRPHARHSRSTCATPTTRDARRRSAARVRLTCRATKQPSRDGAAECRASVPSPTTTGRRPIDQLDGSRPPAGRPTSSRDANSHRVGF